MPRTLPNLCNPSVDSAFLWKRKVCFLFGSNIHLDDTVKKERVRALGERPQGTWFCRSHLKHRFPRKSSLTISLRFRSPFRGFSWLLFCQLSLYSLRGCESQSKLSMSKKYDSIFCNSLISESKPPLACANKTIKISLLGIFTLLFLLLDQFTVVLGSYSSKKPRDGN